MQRLWHLPGNSLPKRAHLEMAKWGCLHLHSFEARIACIAALTALRTLTDWTAHMRMLRAVAKDFAILAGWAEGVVSPSAWDATPCAVILSAPHAGGQEWGMSQKRMLSSRPLLGATRASRRRRLRLKS